MFLQMGLLSDKSILHFLPRELGKKQGFILDSVRMTIEMIDYNYEQLVQCLTNLYNGSEKKNHYKVFSYAWSLVDCSQRLYKIYNKLDVPENSVIQRIEYLYNFRNAIQHLDKNLEEKIIDQGRPIYGVLKWIVCNKGKNEIYNSLLITGVFDLAGVNTKTHNNEEYPNLINDIKLELTTPKKGDNNELNISKLIEDIMFITLALEERIQQVCDEKQLQLVDWSSLKDIQIKLVQDKGK